jgi:uncharacterized protein YcbX
MVPVVSHLFIYPIKSCGGISLSEAIIEERGFRYDRRWMVTDENGVFLTQRRHPQLACARVAISGDKLEISAAGQSSVQAPPEPAEGEPIDVEVWGQTVKALRGPLELEQWFEALLGQSCRVVYMPDTSVRQMALRDSPEGRGIAFSDAFPFLLLSEASVDVLNRRLSNPVPMNRFRPNIVVSGCDAHEEDRWKEIRIGGVPFEVVRPCSRCATTTVDQETGVRGTEPLRTLATYRGQGTKVLFGQNVLHRGTGTLRVGHELAVISSRSSDDFPHGPINSTVTPKEL